jgi:ribose transport system substrate-binding protein
MKDRKWTLGLALLLLVLFCLLGQFAYSFLKIQGIVRDLADTGSGKSVPRHHIVLISQELDNPFWRTIGHAAQEAAQEYNMELEYTGPFRLNPAEQAKLLDKAIAAKVDGILVQGVKGDDYASLIGKAISRGIPVITVDTDAPGSKRLTYVGSDNQEAGRRLGELIVSSVGPKANIGIIIGSREAVNQQLRLEGFLSVMRRYPDIHIAGVGESNISRIQAAQSAEAMLREHPEINVMVGTSALDGVGILQAVKTLNRLDRTKIFGFDDLEETREAIVKGEIEATVIQKPAEMGREAVKALHAYFEGSTLPQTHFTSNEVLDRSNVQRSDQP